MKRLFGAGVLALLGACATLTESNQQEVLVQAILDNHEVKGVGCVLTNKVGRWFVTAPGKVKIQKSVGDLWIDCKKDDLASGYDIVASKVNGSLWGNVIISAGIGYMVDRNTGAGFDYPATLTVLMRANPEPPKPVQAVPTDGSVIY